MISRRGRRDLERTAHPIHDSVFDDGSPVPDFDDTPPGAARGAVNLGGTAVQPEDHQPMRHLGDTDQGDRQPDGGRRR